MPHRQFSEETIPKMMEVDKSTQGTREEQMFYNRKTLKDITEMRHGNPGSQVMATSNFPTTFLHKFYLNILCYWQLYIYP